jgi:hypothetical protein
MSKEIVGKIAGLVFEEAKKKVSKPTKNAVCQHISDALDQNEKVEGTINKKTLSRIYDKFVEGKEKDYEPTAVSIDYLTKYLGFIDYQDFLLKQESDKVKVNQIRIPNLSKVAGIVAGLFILITLAFSLNYGKVSIKSNQKKEIIVFQIKEDGREKELGVLNKKNRYEFSVYLPTGKAEIYYYALEEVDGKEYPGAEMFEVLPLWKSMDTIILSKL